MDDIQYTPVLLSLAIGFLCAVVYAMTAREGTTGTTFFLIVLLWPMIIPFILIVWTAYAVVYLWRNF